MQREIELTALDLRYESYRMRSPAAESRLLAAIAERGIEAPLEGVDRTPQSILLNGFKRYRCAVKLGMGTAPFLSLGEEEATAILNLLRVSNDHSLSILEQAAFLDQLRQLESTRVADLAEQLSRSKSWVSMRLGLIAEMSPRVREKIFSGAFPVYPYMYTLRQFMRMNSVRKQEIEDFVLALSGKKLSVRDIEQLAHAYFRGPDSLRQAIRDGHPGQVLEMMRQVPEDAEGCNPFERMLLKDLEVTDKYMYRVMRKSEDRRLKTPAFHAQANLLTAGILSRQQAFYDSVRKLHDRSGQAQSGVSAAPGRHEHKRDRAPAADQPQHGVHDPPAKGGDASLDAQAQGPH
jgi:predicted transcriptional regulator